MSDGNIERMEGTIASLMAENTELRDRLDRVLEDLAEAYQVVGTFFGMGIFDDDAMVKALDNLHAAIEDEPRPHDDLLPFVPDAGLQLVESEKNTAMPNKATVTLMRVFDPHAHESELSEFQVAWDKALATVWDTPDVQTEV